LRAVEPGRPSGGRAFTSDQHQALGLGAVKRQQAFSRQDGAIRCAQVKFCHIARLKADHPDKNHHGEALRRGCQTLRRTVFDRVHVQYPVEKAVIEQDASAIRQLPRGGFGPQRNV